MSELNKNDGEEFEGIVVYLDPTTLDKQLGEILSGRNAYMFIVDKASHQLLKEGQKVTFRLNSREIAVNVKPVL